MDSNISAIIDNIKQVSMSPSSIEELMEFERVLDENGVYAFHHWKQGELVEGPISSAYRIECTFYWPLEKMPDPAVKKRLESYGVLVHYKKAWLKYPVKVTSPSDYRPGTHKPKIAKARVWLVTINMPKYLIKSMKQSSEEIMQQELNYKDVSDRYQNTVNKNQQEITNGIV